MKRATAAILDPLRERFRIGLDTTPALLWAPVHLQLAERALEHGEPDRALEQLLQLGRKLTTASGLTTAHWRALALAMCRLAARASSREAIAEAVEHYVTVAWSGAQPDDQPVELIAALADAEALERDDNGVQLADLLARHYPLCALGHWAAAHFRERDGVRRGELRQASALANAQRYGRAAELADLGQLHSRVHQHCRLRQGVSHMLSRRDRKRGRTLLRGLDGDALEARDKLWYALGMSRSTFWLDRVRAADAIVDLGRATRQMRPEAGDLEAGEVLAAARFALRYEPESSQPTEADRLSELVELLPLDQRTAARRRLELRFELDEARGLSLERAHDLQARLDELGDELGGAYAASALVFGRLRELAEPETDQPARPLRSQHAFLHGAELACLILADLHSDDDGALLDHLDEARAYVGEELTAENATRARPLSMIWPKLLARLAALRPPRDADEAAREPYERLAEQTIALAEVLAHRAPRPSYGWWALAAHLADQRLFEAAEAVALRAWRDSDRPDDPRQRHWAVGKICAWAIDEADPSRMRTWLEIASQIDA